MGAALSRSLSKIFGSKEMRLLMLGLDAAGKTSTCIPITALPCLETPIRLDPAHSTANAPGDIRHQYRNR